MTAGGTIAAQREALVAWARRRDPSAPVEVAETHISLLALQGGRVFKMKKDVRLPFVDLSTPRLRLLDCEREVAANRPYAPGVYLGVVEVTGADGTVLDHAVEMVRMPAARALSALVAGPADAGAAGPCLDTLADDLVRIHRRARCGPEIDARATAGAVRERWRLEVDQLRSRRGSVVDDATALEVERLADRYLAGRARLFDARIAAGRVRECHGDLLADDIYCTDDGVRVLDCIAFDDRLRWTDVLADVAFLAMDLERLGREDLAARFLHRYREAAGDDWPDSLAHHYVAYRAHVRAKVASLRAEQGEPAAAEQADSLLLLAAAHLRQARVRLVLVGGPPGTGKSTLARNIGRATGWRVLRSDVERKRLAGLDPTSPAPAPPGEGLYDPHWTERTYDALLERAATALALGESVVLDASWSDPDRRAAATRVARETSADLLALRCDLPAPRAIERVRARAAAGGDASDATPEVTRLLHERFAPWPEATRVDTGVSPARAVAAALDALR
jgi:aminoglycoside phosphotransferase family enzyme/predicted kinase